MTTSNWLTNPTSGVWNDASNWDNNEVPNETAYFGESSQTQISFTASDSAQIEKIEFTENASSFTLQFNHDNILSLTITGEGVYSNTTTIQQFVVACSAESYNTPQLVFSNNANAGDEYIHYTAGPSGTPKGSSGSGGGVIRFVNNATAGSANFKVWTGEVPPPQFFNKSPSTTVGGEVSFADTSSAQSATFNIYGTLSTTDGDTFGNVVFHDESTADNATFNNAGGTVAAGDGGNTQFYQTATAANGIFNNFGGTKSAVKTDSDGNPVKSSEGDIEYIGSNGGDVAFDSTSTGADGKYYNYAATAVGSYGGVTSFNNNWPYMQDNQGANAGNGIYITYGAQTEDGQGGGHVVFSAKYGYPSAEKATISNYGSKVASNTHSSAGHTIFSVSQPQNQASAVTSTTPAEPYFPTAAQANIFNYSGYAKGAPGGFTAFAVYVDSAEEAAKAETKEHAVFTTAAPTAGNAIIHNLGASAADTNGGETSFSIYGNDDNTYTGTITADQATIYNQGGTAEYAYGGQTTFSTGTTAAEALLIAYGGENGGYGGKVAFYDQADGGTATVSLQGNAELSLSYHTGEITLAALEVNGYPKVDIQLGSSTTSLNLTEGLSIESGDIQFELTAGDGFAANTAYTVLTAPNLSDCVEDQFEAYSIEFPSNSGTYLHPAFTIEGDALIVTYSE